MLQLLRGSLDSAVIADTRPQGRPAKRCDHQNGEQISINRKLPKREGWPRGFSTAEDTSPRALRIWNSFFFRKNDPLDAVLTSGSREVSHTNLSLAGRNSLFRSNKQASKQAILLEQKEASA